MLRSTHLRAGLAAAIVAAGVIARLAAAHTTAPALQARARATSFHVEEATIDDLHRAIQRGDTTCRGHSSRRLIRLLQRQLHDARDA